MICNVSFLNSVVEKLERFAAWSRQKDRSADFAKALKTIQYRLKHEALDDWSEPFHDVDSMNLQLRFGAIDMIGLRYAVHRVDPVVIVNHIL